MFRKREVVEEEHTQYRGRTLMSTLTSKSGRTLRTISTSAIMMIITTPSMHPCKELPGACTTTVEKALTELLYLESEMV